MIGISILYEAIIETSSNIRKDTALNEKQQTITLMTDPVRDETYAALEEVSTCIFSFSLNYAKLQVLFLCKVNYQQFFCKSCVINLSYQSKFHLSTRATHWLLLFFGYFVLQRFCRDFFVAIFQQGYERAQSRKSRVFFANEKKGRDLVEKRPFIIYKIMRFTFHRELFLHWLQLQCNYKR